MHLRPQQLILVDVRSLFYEHLRNQSHLLHLHHKRQHRNIFRTYLLGNHVINVRRGQDSYQELYPQDLTLQRKLPCLPVHLSVAVHLHNRNQIILLHDLLLNLLQRQHKNIHHNNVFLDTLPHICLS